MATTLITTSFAPDEFKLLIAECISKSVKDELQTLSAAPEQSNVLTRQQTSELLGISLPTLHEYTKKGLLPAYRLGCKVRYKREEVISALQRIKSKII
jgi:excisionase family DNA binding protein